MWFALQQPQNVLDGVDQGPVEYKKLCAGTSRKYQSSQRRLFRWSPFCQLAVEIAELDRFSSLKLIQTRLEGVQCGGVGEDLGCLLERLVLVDRYERGRRPAIARQNHMVPPVGDVAEHL